MKTRPAHHPKVLILLGRPRGGGSEAHAAWLCAALKEAGVSAKLQALFPDSEINPRLRAIKEGWGFYGAYRCLLRLCDETKPDVLICFGRVANGLGHRIKRHYPQIRLWATCRTNRRLPTGYRRSLAEADYVLVNSHWAATRVKRIAGVNGGQVVGIPNALLRPHLIDLDVSDAARRSAREALGLSRATHVLTALAHFVPGKNQEALIECLAEGDFPEGTHLMLVGAGGRLRQCQRKAKRTGVVDYVHFPGRLNQVDQVLQASDLAVSTSLRDSLPNALIEAQAAQLPVVAYDVAGVGESFLPGESGYLVPGGDRVSFASAVNELLQDAGKHTSFAAAAREQCRRRFDPDAVLHRYLELL